MDVYYLNNMVDGMRLNDSLHAEMFHEVINGIFALDIITYEDYADLVYHIGLKLPTKTRVERTASQLVLKLLLNNREAVMGLAKHNGKIKIDMVQDRLVAICT